MLGTDGGGTHWFRAWHRTRPPVGPWPGTGTGSGPCGSPWTTSACWSLQSHCLSAAQWTCHLQEGGGERAEQGGADARQSVGSLAGLGGARSWEDVLPIVSMVSRSSIRSCARGMSMCILSVCCCLFTVSGVLVFLLKRTVNERSKVSLERLHVNNKLCTFEA